MVVHADCRRLGGLFLSLNCHKETNFYPQRYALAPPAFIARSRLSLFSYMMTLRIHRRKTRTDYLGWLPDRSIAELT